MVLRNFIFVACALAVMLPPVPAAFCQGQKHVALDRVVGAVGQVLVSGTEGGRDFVVEGSGVIISPAGLMVTSYHVVQGPSGARGSAAKKRLLFNPADPSRVDFPLDPKKMLRIEIVRADAQRDLALFQIRGYADGAPLAPGRQFPWLRLGSFEDVKTLDAVVVIGFPEVGGETLTVVEGKIAGKDAANEWIKVDASLSRGYSGGAVVNERGELVGIATEVRADVQEVASGGDTAGVRVLYGAMNWVRPASSVERLLKTSGARDSATQASAMIAGHVSSPSGRPVAGALVGLLKKGSSQATTDNLISYVRTDNEGGFKLRTSPGAYTLRIAARGYVAKLQDVEWKRGDKFIRISLTEQK